MIKRVLIFGLGSALIAGCAKSEKVPSTALDTISVEGNVSSISESGSADQAQLSAETI